VTVALFTVLSISGRGQTTISWASATSGTWATGGNWTGGNAPTNNTEIASITATGPAYTVTMATSETIGGLILDSPNATLQVNSSIINIATTLVGASAITAGTLQLNNAEIVGPSSVGEYSFTNAGTITAAGPVTVYGNGGVGNGIAFTNSGSVTVTSGTLTLGDAVGDIITNSLGGTMTANGGTLTLNGGTSSIVNLGTLEATGGGIINFGGHFTTVDLGGTIEIVGSGALNITGSLNNSLSNLPTPTGGSFTLYGGTITGGTVDSGSLAFSGNGGYLSGVAMIGDFTVPTSATFRMDTNTTFSGGTTTFLNNYVYLDGGAGTALTIASGAAWTGNVQVEALTTGLGFVNNGSFTNSSGSNTIYGGSSAGFTFTNTGTVTATGGTLNIGDGGTDTVTNSASGMIEANGGNITLGYYTPGGSVANAGTLEATGSTSTLTLGIGGTPWTNTGQILATSNGTINLGGSFSTANLTSGMINANTGGVLNITGSLNNAGATLSAPNTGIYTLAGGTITGGIVDNTNPVDPALTFGTSGGYLSGVAMNGNFTVPTSATFRMDTNTTFSVGTTTFVDNFVYLDGSAGTAVTIASGAAWTGNVQVEALTTGLGFVNNGSFTNSSGSNSIYGGSNAGFTFANAGTVNATGGTLYIGNGGSDEVTNSASGLIEANGGAVVLGYYTPSGFVANAGTLEATGSTSTLTLGEGGTPWTNTGNILANSNGTINLGGSFSTANLTSGMINANTGGVLNITGGLNNAGATLSAPNTGIYTLAGGTITGGIVDNTNPVEPALTFSASGGYLSGVAMNGNFTVPASASFRMDSNTTFSVGTTTFGGNDVYLDGSAGTALTIASGAAWTGSVQIEALTAGLGFVNNGTFTNSFGSNTIYGGSNTGFTFTNAGTVNATGGTLYIGDGAADSVINSSSGLVEANGGVVILGYYTPGGSVANAGTLEATGSTSTLTLGEGGTPWTNTGHILATANGTINLGGSFSTANLTSGMINANTGGVLNITGGLNNAGATLSAPNTGIYTLAGGTITGGIVDNTNPVDPALTFSGSGGYLSGVAMNGNFTVPASATFRMDTNTTFSGGTTTFLNNDVYLEGAAGTALTIASGATWTGNVQLEGLAAGLGVVNDGTMTNSSGSNSIYGAGYSGFTFVNSGTVSVTGGTLYLGNGTGDAITNNSSGLIEANGGNLILGYYSQSVANAGALEATGSSSTLTLGTGGTPWTNTGSILATANGTVNLGGSFSTANLTSGTINANSGGVLNITGSLNNAGATLAPPNTGIFTLSGGTITGGTVSGGALTFGTSAGTLSGVTMNGAFALPTSPGALFYVNNTVFTGGTTTFPTSGSDYVYLNGPSMSTALTISSSATWTGSMELYNNTGNPLNVVIQGIVDHMAGGDYFYGAGYGLTLTNSGTIEASAGGSLTLGYYAGDIVTNQAGGTIEANGATMYLDSNASNTTNLASGVLTGGTWIATGGGLLDFQGTGNTVVTNGAGTTVILSGSTSRFESGPSNFSLEQTLTTNNGTLEVLSGRNFASTSGAFANNGTIQLGGGTLTTTGSITNGAGSVLSGFGTFNPTGGVTIGSGATVSPGVATTGNYVASMTFNSAVLGTGGSYTFDVSNAGGAAGSGYDTINVTGGLNVAASSFTINLESINPGSGNPGAATFNPATSYQWTLISSSSLTNFQASDFTLNTASFSNSLAGGGFSFTSVGNNIDLNFTPVPEPSTWALMAAGLSVLGYAGYRRREIRA
jgi:hypothetical protein